MFIIFLCDQPHRFTNISQTSELKSATENVSENKWFIHFDGLCNYPNSFQKQPAANCFNSCCFPVRGHVAITLTNLLKQDLTFSLVVMAGVVIVQVVVVVVVKSWPELVNNKLEARANKYKFGARAGKHKLVARVGNCKSRARASK